MNRSAAAAALAALSLACSRGSEDAWKQRVLSGDGGAQAPAPFDMSRPLAALDLDAEEVARGLGAFDWVAGVEWSVSRRGDDARRVHAVERHRVRQLSTGEFAVESEVDPGLGPGSTTGRDLVFAGGVTYGRSRPAPFRERPTDRGRDARRYRDETFRTARSIAHLYGASLAATAAGDVVVAGRSAKRFILMLVKDAAAPPAPARPEGVSDPDPDTKRRLSFLEGRIPVALDGELDLDSLTGAPLRVRIAGELAVKGDPQVRAGVELLAQVKALGGEVASVQAPKDALPDERKAAGVAAALEAAGLKKKASEEKAGREEPSDEAGEP